jgi:hypothetical protein
VIRSRFLVYFGYDAGSESWVCDSGDNEELYAMLWRLATEQGGEEISLKTQ